MPIRLWTDSSVAIGICSRQGLGKVRHLDTYTLWIQQAVRTGRVHLKKVRGDVNPADVFTKHSLTRDKLKSLVELFDCHYREGRAAAAPQLRRSETAGLKISEADGGSEICVISDANQWAETVHDPESEFSGGAPSMPHLMYDQATLDVRYPSLTAPVQLDVDDTEADAYDAIYQRGLREAEGIAESMRLFGRMKYMRQRDSSGDAKALTTRGKGEVCLLRSTGGHTHGCCIAVAGGMAPTRTGQLVGRQIQWDYNTTTTW